MNDCTRRRRLLAAAAVGAVLPVVDLPAIASGAGPVPRPRRMREVTLFLGGDVMIGRGIDQILPLPSRPELYESYVRDAGRYVELAEQVSGRIERPVDYADIWGDALRVLAQRRPDRRVINLETAVTTADTPWPGKGIHYRMHPGNIAALKAAGIDCCVLANNHVMDWGREGLQETLATLKRAGIETAGAGKDASAAAAPAALPGAGPADDARVLVFAAGVATSGIPPDWAATPKRSGVATLADLSERGADALAARIQAVRGLRDLALLSIHWGGNWGYAVPEAHRRFAHRLIDSGAVDAIHGHSSHHPLGVEVYRGRPILYGCGDLLNDYEGIGGYGEYRPRLSLMYFQTHGIGAGPDPGNTVARDPVPSANAAAAAGPKQHGALRRLEAVPMRIERLRLRRASQEEARWLAERMARESARFDVRVELSRDDALLFRWPDSEATTG